MVNVRGVNVYPASIEAIVRRFDDVAEFRSIVSTSGALRMLRVEVELAAGTEAPLARAAAVAAELREALGLTVAVTVMEPGTLPRFEMKASRFLVEG